METWIVYEKSKPGIKTVFTVTNRVGSNNKRIDIGKDWVIGVFSW